jgi:hypothetical protein
MGMSNTYTGGQAGAVAAAVSERETPGKIRMAKIALRSLAEKYTDWKQPEANDTRTDCDRFVSLASAYEAVAVILGRKT